MPTVVEIPGYGEVEFPDSMDEASISAAAKRLYEEANTKVDVNVGQPEFKTKVEVTPGRPENMQRTPMTGIDRVLAQMGRGAKRIGKLALRGVGAWNESGFGPATGADVLNNLLDVEPALGRALTQAQESTVTAPIESWAQGSGNHPAALLAARGWQGVNPLAMGQVGEQAFESFGPAALRLEEALGSPEAAAAAQFLPQAVPALLGALAPAKAMAGFQSVGEAAGALGPAVGMSAAGNALMGAAAAPEGERLQSAFEAATDPLGLAVGTALSLNVPRGRGAIRPSAPSAPPLNEPFPRTPYVELPREQLARMTPDELSAALPEVGPKTTNERAPVSAPAPVDPVAVLREARTQREAALAELPVEPQRIKFPKNRPLADQVAYGEAYRTEKGLPPDNPLSVEPVTEPSFTDVTDTSVRTNLEDTSIKTLTEEPPTQRMNQFDLIDEVEWRSFTPEERRAWIDDHIERIKMMKQGSKLDKTQVDPRSVWRDLEAEVALGKLPPEVVPFEHRSTELVNMDPRSLDAPQEAPAPAAVNPQLTQELPLDPSLEKTKPGIGGNPADQPPALLMGVPPEMIGAALKQIYEQSPRWFKGALRGIRKTFTLPEQRAQGHVLDAIRRWESSHRLNDFVTDKVHGLARDAVSKLSPEGKKRLQAFVNAQIDFRLDAERPSIKTLPPEVQGLFADLMGQMSRREADLIQAGAFTPEQLANIDARVQAGGHWLHREYLARMSKRYRPKPETLEYAVAAMKKNNPALTSAKAAQVLLGFIDQTMSSGKTPNEMWAGSPLQGALKSRSKNIPPFLERAMGLIKDPAYVLAHSAGQMEATWRKYRTSQQFTRPELLGQTWSPEPHPNMWHVPVPNEPHRYAAFAGKYLAPDLYDAVMHAGDTRAPLFQILQVLQSPMKTAKIGLSVAAWLQNGFGNLEAMAGGGLPMWHPRLAPRVKQAVDALSNWNKQVTAKSGPAMWYQWALEDGAIRRGIGAEMSGGLEGRKLAELYVKEPDAGIVGLLQKGVTEARKGAGALGKWYDLADTIPRLATYIEQVERGVRAGLSKEEARSHAASVVSENFASSAMLGPAQRTAAGLGGFLNPFVSWQLDHLRTIGNRLNPLAAQTPGMGGINSGRGFGRAFNTALHYGLIAGALPLAVRFLHSITDDEAAANMERGKKGLKQSFVDNTPLMLPVGPDSKGRQSYVSLRPLGTMEMFFHGGEDVPGYGKPLVGLMSALTDNSLSENTVERFKAWANWSDFNPQNRRSLEGDQLRQSLLAAGQYFEPGTLRTIREGLRRTGAVGELKPGEEQLTVPQALATAAGFRTEPSGAQSAQAARKYGKAAISADQRAGEIRKLIKSKEITPEEGRRLMLEMRKKVQEERRQQRR